MSGFQKIKPRIARIYLDFLWQFFAIFAFFAVFPVKSEG